MLQNIRLNVVLQQKHRTYCGYLSEFVNLKLHFARFQYLNPVLFDRSNPMYQHGPPYDILVDELTSVMPGDHTNEQVDAVYYLGDYVICTVTLHAQHIL